MAKAATEKKTRETMKDLVVGDVQEDTESFKRATLPDDHPLVKAFEKARDEDVTLRIDTPTPRLVERALRKVANERDHGVRIKHGDGFVAFKVTEKRSRRSAE